MKGHCNLNTCDLPVPPAVTLFVALILLALGLWMILSD